MRYLNLIRNWALAKFTQKTQAESEVEEAAGWVIELNQTSLEASCNCPKNSRRIINIRHNRMRNLASLLQSQRVLDHSRKTSWTGWTRKLRQPNQNLSIETSSWLARTISSLTTSRTPSRGPSKGQMNWKRTPPSHRHQSWSSSMDGIPRRKRRLSASTLSKITPWLETIPNIITVFATWDRIRAWNRLDMAKRPSKMKRN
jgi:hypothetical protein